MLRLLRSATIILLIANSAAFLARTLRLTGYPHELDYGEGIVLWQAQHVVSLREAYHSIEHFPYVIFHYPPVYHILCRMIDWAAGDLLYSGRLLAFISTIGVAGVSAAIAWNGIERSRARGLSIGALVAATLVLQTRSLTWAPYMRVDVTAIFLTLLGLLVVIQSSSVRVAAIAAPLFVAAVFTKQTMIAAPLAALSMLGVAGRFRAAVTLVMVMVGVGVLVLIFLSASTGGEFLRHIFQHNQNPYSLRQLGRLLTWNVSEMTLVGLLALSMPLAFCNAAVPLRGKMRLVASVFARSNEDRVAFGIAVYAVVAFVVSLTAGKAGAWTNYFLEWNIALCALAGMVTGRTWQRRWRMRARLPSVFVWLLLGAAAAKGLRPSAEYVRVALGGDAGLHQRAADADSALAIVRSVQGLVLSEDMVLLAKAGKAIPWEPAIVTQLANSGAWNESDAVGMIRRQEFELIVVRSIDNVLFYTPAMRHAIESAYYADMRLGTNYVIMRPRKPVARSGPV